jgi:hypothetical protein
VIASVKLTNESPLTPAAPPAKKLIEKPDAIVPPASLQPTLMSRMSPTFNVVLVGVAVQLLTADTVFSSVPNSESTMLVIVPSGATFATTTSNPALAFIEVSRPHRLNVMVPEMVTDALTGSLMYPATFTMLSRPAVTGPVTVVADRVAALDPCVVISVPTSAIVPLPTTGELPSNTCPTLNPTAAARRKSLVAI